MQILDKVDELTKVLQSLQPIPVDRKNILDKKFRLEFNYNSNHIEGNTLTYGETELLLIFDDTKGNHQMREYEEMKAHDVAYKKVEELANDKERPLMEIEIKNLNKIILVRPFWKDAITSDGQPARREISIGDYKQMPNSVRLQNGEMFHYASPTETPIKMQELIDWYRNEEQVLHPVALAAMLHYNFVRIHPFDDGNGRIARLLLNYVLLRNNLPPVIIKSVDKANYLRALNRADIGDTDAFIEYIGEQLIWSLEISIKAAKGESIDEPGDLDKKLAAFKKVHGHKGTEKIELRNVIPTAQRLRPFIKNWNERLNKFDSLFFSRINKVSCDCTIMGYNYPIVREGHDLSVVYADFLEGLKSRNEEDKKEGKSSIIGKIRINSKFNHLRTLNRNKSYNVGDITISFHQHLYEFDFSNVVESIQKTYNEIPSIIEADDIFERMGIDFFSLIENDVEENEGV